jgi:outer membrane protein assembly factor BamE (lipoprotein component of BamABCDE complex)
MPRRDEFEDEDDAGYLPPPPPPPRPRQGSNPTVIILVVLGAVALVGLIVCGGMFAWLVGGRGVDAPANQPAPEARVIEPAVGKDGTIRQQIFTRDKFKQLVMGKTPEEVIAAVGRPNATDDRPDGSPETWYYYGRVTNPATGKADSGKVEFENGKVVGVRW